MVVAAWEYVTALLITLLPALTTTSQTLSTPAVTLTVLYLIPKTLISAN